MIQGVKNELLRDMRNWRFLVASAGTFAVLLVSEISYGGYSNAEVKYFLNSFQAFQYALGINGLSIYLVVIPILACITNSDSITRDRSYGADALHVSRVGWTRYLWRKWLASILTAGSAAFIGLLFAFIFAFILYPTGLPHLLGWTAPKHPLSTGVYANAYGPSFWSHLFWSHPWLYNLVLMIVPLWATVTLAAMGTALGTLVRRPYLALALPTIIFWVGNIVPQFFNSYEWLPSGTLYLYLISGNTWIDTMVYWSIPIIISSVILVWTKIREEWLIGGMVNE